MSTTDQIHAGMTQVRSDLSLLQESLREASLELVKQPDDTELAGELDQLEREIDGKRRHLQRLTAALEASENEDLDEARRAREAEREAAAQRSAAHRRELEKLAEEFPTVCAGLVEWLDSAREHAIAAWSARCDAGRVRVNQHFNDAFLRAAGAYLAQQLAEAGFSERLIFVTTQRAVGDIDLVEVAKRGAL